MLGLRGVLVQLGVPMPPSRPSCTLWEVLAPVLGLGEGPGAAGGPHAPIPTFLSPLGGSCVPVLGLGEGPGAAGGPHAPILTFLSPFGGVLVPVLELGAGEGRVLVQLGVPTPPS